MSREPDPWATDMNDRLLTEIERLRADQNLAAMVCDDLNREIEKLNDEIEQLRAALEQAVDDFGDGHCVCEQTKQECIAALEPKP